MAGKAVKVILDTNLWISFLITKNFSKLDALLIEKKVKLIFSKELLSEFIAVSSRPRLKKFFSKTDIEAILEQLDFYGELINVTSTISLCRDPKDNFLLALAIDGKADFLLTGDKDLLSLKKAGKTTITTISQYLNSKASEL